MRGRMPRRRPRFCDTLTAVAAWVSRLGYFSLQCVSQSARHRLPRPRLDITHQLGGP